MFLTNALVRHPGKICFCSFALLGGVPYFDVVVLGYLEINELHERDLHVWGSQTSIRHDQSLLLHSLHDRRRQQ